MGCRGRPIFLMIEITLLRHAESVGNAEGVHQGQSDYPLNAQGEAQSHKLQERWAREGRTFDRIISSPSTRARRTAEIVNEALKLPIEFDEDLLERAKGELEHMGFDAAVDRFGEIQSVYQRWGGSGESDYLVYLRAARAFQALVRRGSGKWLVVSHGSLLNMLMRVALGLPLQFRGSGANFHILNTAFTDLVYHPDSMRAEIIRANDRAHIERDPQQSGDIQVTLIRHGESAGNVIGAFQGQLDYDLTAAGLAQAQKLAQRLKRLPAYDVLLASPQTRTMQTAEKISAALDLPITPEEPWKEVDNGQFAGLTGKDVAERWTEEQRRFDPYSPLGFTGESWWDLQIRTGAGIQNLMERGPGRYIIVSHGGTLWNIVRDLLGIVPLPDRHTPNFYFPNTNITQLNFHAERHRWALTRHGDDLHLHDENGDLA
jgi:2,3-bisphosphoglycerate-dependent phosphoglycerate mutase